MNDPFAAGPHAAHASVHLHPGGVFGVSVGRHVHAGLARFPLRPHPHHPRQDVPAEPHLHQQGDSMRKSATGGRHRRRAHTHHQLVHHKLPPVMV